MKTSRWIAAGLVCAALLAGARIAPAATAPSRFAGIDSSLAAFESALGQIETSGRITGQIDLDAALDRYQTELRKSYDTTIEEVQAEARKAVDTHQPGTAAGTRLNAWEKALAAHRARVEKDVSRLTAINMKVRDGRILFAPELLKAMPKDEADELRQWLTPEAVRKYQALDHSLFAGTAGAAGVGAPDFEQTLARELAPPPGCRNCTPRRQTPLTLLDDLLAPDADAAIAAGCVAVCTATPEACVPCLIIAGAGADQLVKLLDSELKVCDSRRTRIGRAICKTAVVLGFIVTIG